MRCRLHPAAVRQDAWLSHERGTALPVRRVVKQGCLWGDGRTEASASVTWTGTQNLSHSKLTRGGSLRGAMRSRAEGDAYRRERGHGQDARRRAATADDAAQAEVAVALVGPAVRARRPCAPTRGGWPRRTRADHGIHRHTRARRHSARSHRRAWSRAPVRCESAAEATLSRPEEPRCGRFSSRRFSSHPSSPRGRRRSSSCPRAARTWPPASSPPPRTCSGRSSSEPGSTPS